MNGHVKQFSRSVKVNIPRYVLWSNVLTILLLSVLLLFSVVFIVVNQKALNEQFQKSISRSLEQEFPLQLRKAFQPDGRINTPQLDLTSSELVEQFYEFQQELDTFTDTETEP